MIPWCIFDQTAPVIFSRWRKNNIFCWRKAIVRSILTESRLFPCVYLSDIVSNICCRENRFGKLFISLINLMTAFERLMHYREMAVEEFHNDIGAIKKIHTSKCISSKEFLISCKNFWLITIKIVVFIGVQCQFCKKKMNLIFMKMIDLHNIILREYSLIITILILFFWKTLMNKIIPFFDTLH